MNPRPARETLDSLRVTLQRLEQTIDPSPDGHDVAELKQILLNRIAELEALQALQPPEVIAPAQAPSELSPIAITAEKELAREAPDQTVLEKLD
jgi:hypothetical protein